MTTADVAWRRIRERLHELQLAAGKPTYTRIGEDTGLHVSTVGNVMRGYSSNKPGWDTVSRIWTHLGGELEELRALHPLTPPTRARSEVYLACPECRSVWKLKLEAETAAGR